MADQIVQSVVEWISMVPPSGIYLILFGIAYVENLVPPMPGDVIVAFGGYLAAEGVISIVPLWGFTVIASVLGFMTMYWLGYTWGVQIEEKKNDHLLLRFIDYKYFKRGKKWMGRWGQGVILANRFLAGTRSVISLTAGMSHLHLARTIVSSLISSILWNALLIGMGWVIRDNWKIIGEYLSNYGKVILLLIVVVVSVKLYFEFYRKGRSEDSEKS